MDFYYSYIDNPLTDIKNKLINIDILKYSYAYLSKFYKNIYLCTDRASAQYLSELPWKNVYIILDEIPNRYKKIWSLGKLYTYKFASQQNRPFIHVDHDFFIYRNLDEDLLKSDIICQSPELFSPVYLDLFYKYSKVVLIKEHITPISVNCGIVGGADYEFFYEYSTNVISMVLNPLNVNFWLNDNLPYFDKNNLFKSMIAEQVYLRAYINKTSKKVNFFFKSDSENEIDYYHKNNIHKYYLKTGAIHLLGNLKYDNLIQDYK